jgi:transcriptional regulator with XRE-family HTH domain
MQKSSCQLGKYLRDRCIASNLTLEQLARKSKIITKTLIQIEKGDEAIYLSDERLQALADSIGGNFDFMVYLSGRVPSALQELSEDAFFAIVKRSQTLKQCPSLLRPLSEEAEKARRPPSPESLLGALHEPIHTDVGRSRVARTARRRSMIMHHLRGDRANEQISAKKHKK